jgi:tetratricopeptide (TPR) repeat protein
VDVKQVGRELGVRYVLEGSVRKAGAKVRITGQLIDASTGTHLWADRFDGGLEDVFDLQDRVTASVVGAIAPKLEQAEIERAKQKPTESLDAYDYYLRGFGPTVDEAGTTEALSLFNQAIELTRLRRPMGWQRGVTSGAKQGWVADSRVAEAERLARRAAELGKDDAIALCMAGLSLATVVGDLDDGAALIDRALLLNPNLAVAWSHSGWLKVYLGEPEVAAEHLARAMRLSPHDPSIVYMHIGAACANFLAGRYRGFVVGGSWSTRETELRSRLTRARGMQVMAGRPEQAQKAMARMRELYPAFRIVDLKDMFPVRRAEDLARWEEALRRAGLPE